MRTKEFGIQNQQLEELMDHLCASCDRDELFHLMAKVNDRITYLDKQEQAFRGLYGRAN
jgi:hypothetical protein